MKSVFKSVVCFLATSVVCQAALESRVLPNGLEILVYADPIVPIVTAELVIKTGASYETPATSGLSHLYEHMFWPDERGRAAGAGSIQNRGISFNASTREESVNFHLLAPRAELEASLRYLHDAVLKPDFPTGRLVDQSQMVLAEIGRAKGNPTEAMRQRVLELLFPRNTTFKSPLGVEGVVASASAARLRTLYTRFVDPGNAAIVVAGACDPEAVFKLCTEVFGDWKRSQPDAVPSDPGPPPAKAMADVIVSPRVESVIVRTAWRGPGVSTDRNLTFAADVLSEILRDPGSRFQRALVDSGLAVGVDVMYYTQRWLGISSITFNCEPAKAKEAMKKVKAELAALNATDYFSDAELENARTAVIRDELLERENVTEYSHSIGFWWASAGTDYFKGRFEATKSVGRPEIQAYIDKYLHSPIYAAVAVVPEARGLRNSISTADLLAP